MKGIPCLAAVLWLLVGLTSGACAQERNELTGLIGRTFVSDHAVTGTSTPGALLTSERGLSVEANYGRRLFDSAIAGHYDLNLVPKDYKSFFVTPALRANLSPDKGISPWVSAGGGFGYFKENSMLESGGANPGKTGTTTGIFQFGAGLDVKLFSRLSVRGGVRDFFSGVPQLNVDTGKTRQHNFFVGAGVVYHF